MRSARQSSESVELAVFLTLSGGLMDAYSYLARDHVFANAQTGNMLLLGVSAARGDVGGVVHYLLPVMSFAVGIALAQALRLRARDRRRADDGRERLHWRQLALLAEVALLLVVGFVPAGHSVPANCLASLACGIQVQAFRKVHGRSYASTMCIGNLRSGVQRLVDLAHDPASGGLTEVVAYFGVICCFVAGAVAGYLLLPVLGLSTIHASCVLLLVAFALMFRDRERERAARLGAPA